MPVMLPWTTDGAPQVVSEYGTTPTGTVTVTAHATVNTVGSWAVLSASTPYTTDMICVEIITGPSATGVATGMLLTLGVGASSSENPLVENMNVGSWTNQSNMIPLPIRVPAGSRLVARCQSVVTVATIVIRAHLFPMPGMFRSTQMCTTYGASTATSRGTNLAATGAAAWSAWTQVVASTTRAHRWLLCTPGASNATFTAAETHYLQIGAGGAGSEQIVVPYLRAILTTAEAYAVGGLFPHRVELPVATRLSVRGWAPAARAFNDVTILGFD